MLSTDAALQRVKGIKKSFDTGARFSLEENMKNGAFNMTQTPEVTEIFTSTESLSGSKELGELETPPVLTLQDGYSVTISEKRFGGAIVLSSQVYKREGQDSTWRVKDYLTRQRDKALVDNKRLFLTNAHKMYNESFDSTSLYLAPDGVEVCGAHSWKSGAAFSNFTTSAFSLDNYEDLAWAYAGNFTDGAGKEMPLNWTHIVVKKGSTNNAEAIRAFAKECAPTTVNDINIYQGMLTVVETPFISNANKDKAWLLDLSEFPSPLELRIGLYPSMDEPILLENGAIRSNIEGFWKQGVTNMPYQVYGFKAA